jgi:cellulose synthase/poly-beta-1,6-N-acetylglucosamine synthase-like glycosyltransferase
MTGTKFAFAAILLLLFYVYLGYPVLLYLYGLIFRKNRKTDSSFQPTVTLIIPAHNEEDCIEKKIRNALELDYPKQKLEIIVASDASTDSTMDKAGQFGDRIKLLDFRERSGKMGIINKAVKSAAGDILVLTDANTMFARYTIKELVKHFAEPEVGCVCGAKIIRNEISDINSSGMGETGYWRYEAFLKRAESLSGSCVSADGSVYAVRRSAYPFPPDNKIIMDDLAVTLMLIKQGHACVFEPAARAFEESSRRIRDEFRRKTRIFAGAFSLFVNQPGVLFSRVFFKVFSHKILRWLTFVLQVLLFALSYALSADPFFRPIFGAQAIFYACTAVGILLNHFGARIMIFHLPYYFNMTTFAQVWGLVYYIMYGNKPAWEKRR